MKSAPRPGSFPRGSPWSHDEVVLALRLYRRLKRVPEEYDPLVLETAYLIGRSADSVVYKIANLRFLDSGGKKGLKHIGKTDRLVWEEFKDRDDLLKRETDRILENVVGNTERYTGTSHGQGFAGSTEDRRKIESIAMERAAHHFSSQGYYVEDVHVGGPYDLKCTRQKEVLFVEVKGTTGDGKNIMLTAGEVNFARKHLLQMALYVLHSIKLEGNGSRGKGTEKVVRPWTVDDRKLTAYNFFYRL